MGIAMSRTCSHMMERYDNFTCEIGKKYAVAGSPDVMMQAEVWICCLCTAVTSCCWRVWLQMEKDFCYAQQEGHYKVLLRTILHMRHENQGCQFLAAELTAAVVWRDMKGTLHIPFSFSQRSMTLDVSHGLTTCTGVAPYAPLCGERASFAHLVTTCIASSRRTLFSTLRSKNFFMVCPKGCCLGRNTGRCNRGKPA